MNKKPKTKKKKSRKYLNRKRRFLFSFFIFYGVYSAATPSSTVMNEVCGTLHSCEEAFAGPCSQLLKSDIRKTNKEKLVRCYFQLIVATVSQLHENCPAL